MALVPPWPETYGVREILADLKTRNEEKLRRLGLYVNFEDYLAAFWERHPEWKGTMVGNRAEPPKEARFTPLAGPQKAGTQPWKAQERLDWAERASGAEAEMENDAQEPIE